MLFTPLLSPSVDSDLCGAGSPAPGSLRQSVNIYCAPSPLSAMALLVTFFKINKNPTNKGFHKGRGWTWTHCVLPFATW